MKRYLPLTIIFLALVVAIVLSSCSPAPAAAPAAPVDQAVSTSQAAPQAEKTVSKQTAPAAASPSAPLPAIPVTGPTQSPEPLAAEVTADVLNVRIGPGLNHRILTQLAAGQTVRLDGRSLSGEWLNVHLADGRDGWVYNTYLRTSANLAALPVLEAYGGPVTADPAAISAAQPTKRYRLNVSISANQAAVSLAGFAAQRDVTLRLAAPGQGLAMTVATATTDAQGSANLTFPMPALWPDGSAVTQSALDLVVLSADGTQLGKARISYQYQ